MRRKRVSCYCPPRLDFKEHKSQTKCCLSHTLNTSTHVYKHVHSHRHTQDTTHRHTGTHTGTHGHTQAHRHIRRHTQEHAEAYTSIHRHTVTHTGTKTGTHTQTLRLGSKQLWNSVWMSHVLVSAPTTIVQGKLPRGKGTMSWPSLSSV